MPTVKVGIDCNGCCKAPPQILINKMPTTDWFDLGVHRFIRSTTASTRPLPTKRKLKTDLETKWAVCQQPYILLFQYVIHIHIICKKTKEQRVVERRSSWFTHSPTAATRPQPIERASNTDLVTVLAVYQEYHYSPMMILMKPRVWSLLKRWFVVLGFPFIIIRWLRKITDGGIRGIKGESLFIEMRALK